MAWGGRVAALQMPVRILGENRGWGLYEPAVFLDIPSCSTLLASQ